MKLDPADHPFFAADGMDIKRDVLETALGPFLVYRDRGRIQLASANGR